MPNNATATGTFNGMKAPSDALPYPQGTADPGISSYVSRADHVHPAGAPGPVSPVLVIVGDDALAAHQPYRLVLGVATIVTSQDVAVPFVDGVTLESGGSDDTVKAGNLGQAVYLTAGTLPSGDVYYLGQDGKLTSTVPSALAGDLWQVAVARKIDSTHLVFTPQEPIALS